MRSVCSRFRESSAARRMVDGASPVEPGHLADLGRDDHAVAVAPCRHPVADDRLGFAAAIAGHPDRVRVGRVDEVATGRGVGVEHGERLRLVDRPAEDVAAEAEREDGEIRPPDRPHQATPISVRSSAAGSAACGSAGCSLVRRSVTPIVAAAAAKIAPNTKAR